LVDYLTETFNLQGKVAALTGAGGFLVSEMARGLACAGVKVAVLDKDLVAVEKVAAEIYEAGGEAIVGAIDVTSVEDYEKCLQLIKDAYGDLDYAVFGANLNAPTPFLEIPLDEWNDILAVQLTGTMLGLRVFGEYMVKQGKGSMVTISSASAGPPLSKAFTYSVAKAGVKNLTQNVARECAASGIFPDGVEQNTFYRCRTKRGNPRSHADGALWRTQRTSGCSTVVTLRCRSVCNWSRNCSRWRLLCHDGLKGVLYYGYGRDGRDYGRR
jgi:NADP-dependent 3-hydroxy acid dehydrogenase YdfG